jgi:hypothetical protein
MTRVAKSKYGRIESANTSTYANRIPIRSNRLPVRQLHTVYQNLWQIRFAPVLVDCLEIALFGAIVGLRRLEAAVPFRLRGRCIRRAKRSDGLLVGLRFCLLRWWLSLSASVVIDVIVAEDSKSACLTVFRRHDCEMYRWFWRRGSRSRSGPVAVVNMSVETLYWARHAF